MAARVARAALLLASSIPYLVAGRAVVGKTFMAGSTDPTAGSTPWALTSHGIAEKTFTVDKDGNVVPQIAENITKVDKFTWEVRLKADYSFSDGTAVTADNVATALNNQNQNNGNAQQTVGTMTFTAEDGLTVRVVSERAHPAMDAVLAEWAFVVYLQKDDEIFFTGPYAVETFVAGDRIDLVPNMYYPMADQRPMVTIKKYAGGENLATALEEGAVDLAFHLPVDLLPGLRQQDGISIRSTLVGYHEMMHYNTLDPQLSDQRVRSAIDKVIDRQALSQELRGGRATHSLFPKTSPYVLQTDVPLPDKAEAETLLNEAGWTLNGDGKREKDGELLNVTLVAYPQRPNLPQMQPLITQSLMSLGIQVNSITTSADSWNQLDTIMADRSWDLLLWAQHTLPGGDPQWFLNAFFRSDGNRNYAGLNVTEIDGMLDGLADAADYLAAVNTVHTAILDQVPVSNLVTPEWHVGLSERVSSYEVWGSDYYVVRADFGLGCCGVTTTEGTTTTEETEETTKKAMTEATTMEATTTEAMEADGSHQVILDALPALASLFLSSAF